MLLFGCVLVMQDVAAAAPSPQSNKARRREEQAARTVLGKRSGRYDGRGSLDTTYGYGEQSAPVQMFARYEVEPQFEGMLLLERTATRYGKSEDEVEGWNILSYRSDTKQYWSVSFDSRRTPFTYLVGKLVDGRLQLADPGNKWYAIATFGESNRWTATSGFVGAKRPLQALTMTPVDGDEPVEVVATTLRAPLVPARLNRRRDDKDPAAHWHEQHEQLAALAGDYATKDGRQRVRARVVCQGRFLLWMTERDGVLTELEVTGFNGLEKHFAHWRVAASDLAPHPFRGALGDGKLTLEAFHERGRIVLDVRKEGRLELARRGTGGRGRAKLVRQLR